MQQIKISLKDDQIDFISNYSNFGFKDKSSAVRAAIDEYRKRLDKKELMKSAELYAEIYEQDEELRDLTNSAMEDWPV